MRKISAKLLSVMLAAVLLVVCVPISVFSSADGEITYFDAGTYLIVTDSNAFGEVVIPDEVSGKPVREIADSAFLGCSEITSFQIGANVEKIGNIFADLVSVTEYKVSLSNTHFKAVNGVLFSYDQSRLMRYPSGSASKAYSVPSGVKTIGNYAFSGCTSLLSVVLPSGMESIEHSVFLKCSKLMSIRIPDTVTSISDSAFAECLALKSVTLKNGNMTVGDSAFLKCGDGDVIVACPTGSNTATRLTEMNVYITSVSDFELSEDDDGGHFVRQYVGNGGAVSNVPQVEAIGDYAFFNSTVTSVKIPATVEKIGAAAFAGCESMTSIEVPDTVTSIGDKALGYKLNPATGAYELIADFTIICANPSAAYSYAIQNSIRTSTGTLPVINILPDNSAVNVVVGDEFSFSYSVSVQGLELVWTSSNNNVATVDSDGTLTALSVGNTSIKVAMKDNPLVFTSVTVNVISRQVVSISISKPANKTQFYTFESLDTTGLELTVVYNSENTTNKTAVIKTGFEVSCDLNSEGTKTVTVSFGGKSTSYKVTVTTLSIEILPDNSDVNIVLGDGYTVACSASAQGMELVWTSSNTDVATVNANGKITALSPGNTSINVAYKNYPQVCASVTVSVIARRVTSLSIYNPASKTEYYTGATLDTTGLELKVTYNNEDAANKVAYIKTGFTVSCDLNSEGTKTVTVSFGGKSVTYRITVENAEFSIMNGSAKIDTAQAYRTKVKWYRFYSKYTLNLSVETNIPEGDYTVEWSSSNKNVPIDADGTVKNSGWGSRSSYITATIKDKKGNVIKDGEGNELSVRFKVMFYKFNWQMRKLEKQSFVSDNPMLTREEEQEQYLANEMFGYGMYLMSEINKQYSIGELV